MPRPSSHTSRTADADTRGSAAPGAPYLIAVGAAGRGGQPTSERLAPIGDALIIGRRPAAGRGVGVLALDDRLVSAEHARIDTTADGFEIEDLDSRNGTLVDGRAIDRARLRDGMLLSFGGHAAIFRLLGDEAREAIEEELRSPLGPVASASPAMAMALAKLRRLAPTREEVLLGGETGTGKEVYARAIHKASGRPGPFVGLNCAALPTELVESELFGYARGAHSQARQSKRGLIEQAEGGTLFLDEIGDMPAGAQAKLLRFLQERKVLPLGGAQARRVDVRVIAATNRIVTTQGEPPLRRDLLARLGAQPIVLPPLRERPEDIGALAHHFLGGRSVAFESRAFLALCLHGWPANVRELEKTIREAAIFSEGKARIGVEHLPTALGDRLKGPASVVAARRRSPRAAPCQEELEALLRKHGGNVAHVAREIDRRWAVVRRWIVQYGIEMGKFRGGA